jgi:hypothetical protein
MDDRRPGGLGQKNPLRREGTICLSAGEKLLGLLLVALFELVDPTCGIHEYVLTGEERMRSI